MPLFQIKENKLSLIKLKNFNYEKEIQQLVENNLDVIFNCEFIASEFSTGQEHAGRIDSLALSEDYNPVIIEYKKVESSELINQSLFYLSWIKDHKGDFQVAVNNKLKKNIEIDWEDIRVICIAPGYKKYDLHAVQMMGANIELWQYRLYENGALYLDEVFRKSSVLSGPVITGNGKNPVMVEAGRKAAITRKTGVYSFEEHLSAADENIKSLLVDLKDYILNIDESIEEIPKKFYIAYKLTQNFVCVELKKNKLVLFLKLNPKDIEKFPSNGRDVSNIGHVGTGKFELTISTEKQLEESKDFIRSSYENIGG